MTLRRTRKRERGEMSAGLLVFVGIALVVLAIGAFFAAQGKGCAVVKKQEPSGPSAPSIPADPSHITYYGDVVTGADGEPISLNDSGEAHNPSWGELWDFLRRDATDTIPYNSEVFLPQDYAERLHNNAEANKIRCGIVIMKLSSGPMYCNSFDTTDQGVVYIDCIGLTTGDPADKRVWIGRGEEYEPQGLFEANASWESKGRIIAYTTRW